MHAKDPDFERSAAAKLRREHKGERKGAIRELRKDAKFMANTRHELQEAKDRAYGASMKKVFSNIETERAEEKQMQRTKVKERKRAGRG